MTSQGADFHFLKERDRLQNELYSVKFVLNRTLKLVVFYFNATYFHFFQLHMTAASYFIEFSLAFFKK